MIVTPAAAQQSPVQATPSDGIKTGLDYNSFLNLLIATMKNQDPTKPNDPAETLSQLAAFSTVEQNIKLNTKLEALLTISAGGQASGLIGKTLTSGDGLVTGVASSVEVGASGLTAILQGGERLEIRDGVRIS